MSSKVLLCDIGKGDYLRLALSEAGGRPQEYNQYAVSSLKDFEAAILQFLASQGDPILMAAAISAAGWEDAHGVSLPNYGFRIERARIRELLNIQRLHLVNDCVSKALSVQCLKSSERDQICGGQSDDEQAKGLIGVGLGLGMAGLIPDDLGQWTALPCEGGHSDLAATNARELAVLGLMIQKFGHVSRERAVSISGLAEIWRCLSALDNAGAHILAPEEVVALAYAQDPRALEAVNMCVCWLASFASDLALMLGARGGIYLSGGLIELIGDLMDNNVFAQRFCDKGRLSNYLREVPVYKITIAEPEIIGLTTLFN